MRHFHQYSWLRLMIVLIPIGILIGTVVFITKLLFHVSPDSSWNAAISGGIAGFIIILLLQTLERSGKDKWLLKKKYRE